VSKWKQCFNFAVCRQRCEVFGVRAYKGVFWSEWFLILNNWQNLKVFPPEVFSEKIWDKREKIIIILCLSKIIRDNHY
jgi:hypothetical protein